jgi:predicted nuclease with TOPRIM domain
MNERMSLERIDEYMKQLKAVTDYDKVCEELEKIRKKFAERGQTLYFSESFAQSLTLRMDEMQQESEDKEERIRQCHAKLDNEHEYISLLEYSLKMARQEISSLKKRQEVIGNQSHYTSKKSYRFNDFVSLGIIIDGPKTTLTRKMNAIYYLLLTNGLIRV